MLHRLPREMSDHCPLLVSDCLLENGYRPFKFLDCWLQLPNFKNIIRGFWFDGCTALPGRFRFIKKLSFVAAQLRQWNKDAFGDQEHKLQVVLSQIDDLERKQEADSLCPSDHLKLESLIRDKWTYSNRVECKWRQRSRQLWCKLGDRNTRFFHLIANFRRAKSQIMMINHKGVELRSLPEIKSAAVDYFYNLYKAPIGKKAEMGPVGFKRLNSQLSLWLEREVTSDEIKRCVWDCDGSKSPGPDGFNFKFYKLAWDFIAEDLFDLITEFFRTGSMPKGVNLSYITLVPKKKVTSEFKEYRPISLIHGIYKIIAKILSNRLKEVIGSLISDNQTAFIADRQIVDGFMVANEVVYDLKSSRRSGLIFKVDFHKAFDSVL